MGFWNELREEFGFDKPKTRPSKVAIQGDIVDEQTKRSNDLSTRYVAKEVAVITSPTPAGLGYDEPTPQKDDVIYDEYKNLSADDFIKMVHDEIDGLYLKTITAHEDLLATLNIIPASHVEGKGEKLKKLGFTNRIEQVEMYEALARKNKEIEAKAEVLEKEVRILKDFNRTYGEKILRWEDFKQVLVKYNLVYNTAANYKMDIPEKNVDEMLDSIATEESDFITCKYAVTNVENVGITDKQYEEINNMLFNSDDYYLINDFNSSSSTRVTYSRVQSIVEKVTRKSINWDSPDNWGGWEQRAGSARLTLNKYAIRNSLYIAAPISHFDMSGSTKIGSFSYVPNLESVPMPALDKDPIAFKFLKGNYVRIISKWGTSDDQSYLDPRLNS